MKVAVTGANGFVGRRLVADFARAGHEVAALSRRRIDQLHARAAWLEAPDLGPAADWRTGIAGAEVVVHAAARVHIMEDKAADPLAEYRVANVEGTLALARQAAEAGVRRFVFISSIKVNGEVTEPNAPFRPDDPPRPVDPYGVSKGEAEAQLFALGEANGMEVVAIRSVLVYGPGVRANFGAMMSALAKGVPLPLGAVRNRRSLLFVGNLSDLVMCAAQHPGAAGRVFLGSDGEDLSTSDMLRRLGIALGRPARLVPVPPALLRSAAALLGKGAQAQRLLGSLQVDIGPTRSTLDWAPPFSVEQGFAETAAAFREARRS
ncbi:MAG: NAD-dependent epimerase/dehydratase family protein [Sphingomicrobium sp.]